MMLLSTPSWAQQEDANPQPDLALLEFLGEWEDEQGNWLDPLQFDALSSNDEENNDD